MTTIPTVLTLPRLPKATFYEQQFVQSASGFPGLIVDSHLEQVYVDRTQAEQQLDHVSLAYLRNNSAIGAWSTEYASGLQELLNLPKDWFKGVAISSQLVGPISLGVYLTDEQQRSLIYDPMLLEALAHHIALRAAWLSDQLALLAENIIICVDEPFLDAFNSPFFPIDWERGRELLEIVFAGVRGCRGIAIGKIGTWQRDTATTSYWTPLLQSSVELILIDVYNNSDILLNSAPMLPAFLQRPGFIVWGLVPTDKEALAMETIDSLTKRFYTLLQRLVAAGVPHDTLLQASFISTSSNLAHLPIPTAEHALQLCNEVSQRIRLTYGLTTNT
jgi:hypothetical protein